MEVKQRPVYLASRIYGPSTEASGSEQLNRNPRDDSDLRAIG